MMYPDARQVTTFDVAGSGLIGEAGTLSIVARQGVGERAPSPWTLAMLRRSRRLGGDVLSVSAICGGAEVFAATCGARASARGVTLGSFRSQSARAEHERESQLAKRALEAFFGLPESADVSMAADALLLHLARASALPVSTQSEAWFACDRGFTTAAADICKNLPDLMYENTESLVA